MIALASDHAGFQLKELIKKYFDENNIELSKQRLSLVEATRITMANALNLIGVSAPEKM